MRGSESAVTTVGVVVGNPKARSRTLEVASRVATAAARATALEAAERITVDLADLGPQLFDWGSLGGARRGRRPSAPARSPWWPRPPTRRATPGLLKSFLDWFSTTDLLGCDRDPRHGRSRPGPRAGRRGPPAPRPGRARRHPAHPRASTSPRTSSTSSTTWSESGWSRRRRGCAPRSAQRGRASARSSGAPASRRRRGHPPARPRNGRRCPPASTCSSQSSSSVRPGVRRRSCLTAATPSGAAAAMAAASSRALSSAAPGSESRTNRPCSNAVWAEISLPVRASSTTSDWGRWRGSRSRAPPPGNSPNLTSGEPKPGRARADEKIGDQRQLQTSAHGDTLDGGDQRLAASVAQNGVDLGRQPRTGERLEVHPGAEVAARTGQDPHTHVVVRVERSQRVEDAEREVRVDGVARLGPVERDDADLVDGRRQDGLRHGARPARSGLAHGTSTGSFSQPRTVEVRACTALASSISQTGKRRSTSSRATRASSRARCAPRQKCNP